MIFDRIIPELNRVLRFEPVANRRDDACVVLRSGLQRDAVDTPSDLALFNQRFRPP